MEKKKYKSDEDYRYRGPKITVMQPSVVNVDNVPVPSESVATDVLCRNGNPVKYRDCDEYNTVFCHHECEFGPKTELPLQSGIKFTPVTKDSYDDKKHSFLLDDEMAHFTRETPIEDVNLDYQNPEGK